jgi:pyruvate/2-oxoglutarate dehydrogenase complex dihydrolipoamide dehydrogenase (E3) component/uncharacterized membrane protein YdjX (TVP38/TMEM64 family)
MNAAASPQKSPASSSALRWVGLAAVVLVLLALGRWAGGEIPRFAEWVASLGALGPLVFILGYAVAIVAFVPASVLTLAAGAIFGLGAGVVYVFCAATLGSALAFLVSRYLARGVIEKRLAGNENFAAIDRAIAGEGRKIVFLLRLSPAFPFTLLNYALGLTRVRFADYLVASFGMLPGTFLYVYYGKLAGDVAALAGGATTPKDAGYYGVLALGLAATIAVTAVVTRTARRALAASTSSREPASGETRRPLEEVASSLGAASGTGPIPAAHAGEPTRPGTQGAGTSVSDPPIFEPTRLEPMDEHNRALLDNVRPSNWVNPEPAPIYDLVVVGAGTGGLICAAVASGLGAKVALIERNLMGGDCLNVGCVPSKAVIRHSRRLAEARGILGSNAFDDDALDREFAAAMERMRAIRAEISRDDSAKRYRDELGVHVFQGSARFTGPDAVEISGRTLRFKKAVVATGARAAVPNVPGLAEAGYLTNENVFNLTTRPRRLVVLGGGPIGCELAQAMQRLGCDVTLIDKAEQLLPREDRDAAAILERRLKAEGVTLVPGTELLSVTRDSRGKTLTLARSDRHGITIECDEILVAVGRRANVEGVGLDAAGIATTDRGIQVDDNLRTTNPRVFAVGDCCLRWQFTHAADAAAKIVVQNALFFGRKKLSDLVMPWCTYTEPEIAHVGLSEAEARLGGIEVETFTVPLSKVNRAVCDGETDGFVRLHAKKGSDRILGATIVATHAGEMISEVTLAMTTGAGLAKIAATIHPYPTQAEGIKAAANAYMRTKLTPTAKKVLGLLLRVQR